jgi:uncharacterized protein YdeI (BOF family)
MFLVLMLVVATAAMSAEVAKPTDGSAVAIAPYTATSVAAAKAAGVDTGVLLSGQVIKMIKPNEFLLDDGTGELMVFTKEGALDGQNIVNAKVEVAGQISQNFMYTEVEADSVKVIQ